MGRYGAVAALQIHGREVNRGIDARILHRDWCCSSEGQSRGGGETMTGEDHSEDVPVKGGENVEGSDENITASSVKSNDDHGDRGNDDNENDDRDNDDNDNDDDGRANREADERAAHGDDTMDVETKVVAPAKEMVPRTIVDRTKVCPFLLRVFPKENEFNRMDEFSRARLPQNELQIYTWMSETLRTLTQLIKSQLPAFRAKDTQFYFGAAFPDNRGNYTLKTLGMTQGGRKGSDDQLSLGDLNFRIGHYLLIKVVCARDAGPGRGGDGDLRRDGRNSSRGDFRGGRDGPRMDRMNSRDGRDGRSGRPDMGGRDRDRDRDSRRRW